MMDVIIDQQSNEHVRVKEDVSPGACWDSTASAIAASSSLRMLVSSSMMRRWTAWIRPAPSAAKTRGSRAATAVA